MVLATWNTYTTDQQQKWSMQSKYKSTTTLAVLTGHELLLSKHECKYEANYYHLLEKNSHDGIIKWLAVLVVSRFYLPILWHFNCIWHFINLYKAGKQTKKDNE